MKNYLQPKLLAVLEGLGYAGKAPLGFDKPKLEIHGDIATNIAMLLAKAAGKNPRAIAQEIVAGLDRSDGYLEKVEIAGPGFINFKFADRFYARKLGMILEQGASFGRSTLGEGRKALVEFVSANPTGPLSVGHGRQAVLGDTLCNLLAAVGWNVTREYYYNNAGRQMRVLAESTFARYRQRFEPDFPFPEDAYHGEYIVEIAAKLAERHGNSLLAMDAEQALAVCKEAAEGELFEAIKAVLKKIGLVFDNFFNEDSLYKNGMIDDVVSEFRRRDLAYDNEGAVWFRTTSLGLDQDRVIIKSTGEPTYRLPDIAYHREKFRRGFDMMVDIFGADHIATIPDVLAGVKALGFDPGQVKVVIHQFVTLMRNGEQVKMSKRTANFVTLDELVEDVGVDAVRFFFNMRSPSSHLEFDLDLAKEQSEKNPVYYLQYAHARIASILRFGETEGVIPSALAFKAEGVDLNLLTVPSEIALIKLLLDYPAVVESAAGSFEPHRLCSYLGDVAAAFHKFYHESRVVIPERDLSMARLALCWAAKRILANGLAILGVSAPEKM